MKKLASSLMLLLLAGCSTQSLPQAQFPQTPTRAPQFAGFNAPTATAANTARTGFPLAMAELQKVDPQAQLYEVDVWQEEGLGKSLHYGFLYPNGETFRVIIDVASQTLKTETGFKGSHSLVYNNAWKLDSDEIYARAQNNGLRDRFYLATLWEDTWHISGLKQHLYFQMDAQNGDIKLRCIGPYLNHCTLADGSPVHGTQDLGKQKHLQARQSR